MDVFARDVGAERAAAILSTETIGVEIDGVFACIDFTVRAAATFRRGEMKGAPLDPAVVGNRIGRQPEW